LKRPIFRLVAVTLFIGLAVFSTTAQTQVPSTHKPQQPRSALTLAGEWSGSLQAGDAVLHLVLHVSKS
jgi:hypothetical protein